MNEEEFKTYLERRYYDFIDWYRKHAKQNLRVYQVFQWSLVILSALTPALILIEEVSTKWIAVSVAVMVAISSAALKTFKYQENWLRYRTTEHALQREIFFLEAGIQGYEKTEDKEALFVQRVESLIAQEVSEFVALQEKKGER